MNRFVCFCFFLLGLVICSSANSQSSSLSSQSSTPSRRDSLKVVRLLEQGRREATAPLHLWYARQLTGTPYVGQTLEVNKREKLVVNLRELDCTTFVETALALGMTQQQGSVRFEDYCRNLQTIRYRNGRLDGYASRNHYFTQWITSNEGLGIVSERELPLRISRTQKLDLHYMSQHPQSYPRLKKDTNAQAKIRQYERESDGRTVRYIPRDQLNQPRTSALGVVQDGDILAIVTKKDGLDTSHIGFAVWGKDGRLHLLNASQIHKCVVEEPMTLYEYMGKHPTQLGVRVIEVKSER